MSSQPPIVSETQELARYVGTIRRRVEALEQRGGSTSGDPAGTAAQLVAAHEAAANPHPQYAGGGGSQEVYVQSTRPTGLGPWVWWVTDAGKTQILNCVVNTGT